MQRCNIYEPRQMTVRYGFRYAAVDWAGSDMSNLRVENLRVVLGGKWRSSPYQSEGLGSCIQKIYEM